jgi:hypothetical protein
MRDKETRGQGEGETRGDVESTDPKSFFYTSSCILCPLSPFFLSANYDPVDRVFADRFDGSLDSVDAECAHARAQ